MDVPGMGWDKDVRVTPAPQQGDAKPTKGGESERDGLIESEPTGSPAMTPPLGPDKPRHDRTRPLQVVARSPSPPAPAAMIAA